MRSWRAGHPKPYICCDFSMFSPQRWVCYVLCVCLLGWWSRIALAQDLPQNRRFGQSAIQINNALAGRAWPWLTPNRTGKWSASNLIEVIVNRQKNTHKEVLYATTEQQQQSSMHMVKVTHVLLCDGMEWWCWEVLAHSSDGTVVARVELVLNACCKHTARMCQAVGF